jgi:hypothetical protein
VIAAMKVTTPEGRAAARAAADAVTDLLDEVEETDENEDGREELWSILTWLTNLSHDPAPVAEADQ